MKITIFGTGYVGLVTAACLAKFGNEVLCIDTNKTIINGLNKGRVPFYEPHLEKLIKANAAKKNISFSSSISKGIEFSSIFFVCIGTPQKSNGSSDTSSISKLADEIIKYANEAKDIFIKSTVPVGFCNDFCNELNNRSNYKNTVSSNPEFLREGSAVKDFLKPDRVIVGTKDKRLQRLATKIYSKIPSKKIIFMNSQSSELSKYAANSFLATKISFINEIAKVARSSGADIRDVQNGIGSDNRIGKAFLYSGLGYGGSCFPKDINSLIYQASSKNIDLSILSAVRKVNDHQLTSFKKKILNYYQNQTLDKVITIWGMAFKPNTSDIRESRGLELARYLSSRFKEIRIFDPLASKNAKEALTILGCNNIRVCNLKYSSIANSSGLIVAVEDLFYSDFEFAKFKKLIKNAVIFDGRNIFNKENLELNEIQYLSF